MKIYQALLLLGVLFSTTLFAQKNDPVLITIGDEDITRSEFTAVYKKNNVDGEVMDKKSVAEYLDLYIKFKLKVKEAEALGMDTVQSFIKELSGYREQLAQPYLIDEETNKYLIQEAYERKKEDMRASHILLRVDKNALPKDTLQKYNEIMAIRDRIIAGEDFSAVAAEVSEDPSVRDRDVRGRIIPGNNGDLGYFTVFDMVYPFENAAYNTKEGEISMPVRTDFGYHILKVERRQPAMGKVQVAHILLKYEGEKTTAQKEELQKKINEIYEEIKEGKSFEDAAAEYSEDPGSAPKGGVLPWFGSNRMIPEFIDVVTTLKEKGSLSEPFETSFGWHIVKLIDTKPIGSFEEEKDDIKNRLARSDRSNKSTESLVKKVLNEYGFQEYKTEKSHAYEAIDSTVFTGKMKIDNIARFQKPIFKIGDKKVMQKDFLEYVLKKQERANPTALTAYIDDFYKGFVEQEAIAYEDSQLENKYPEFRLLMQEYRDGILLFDLMDKKIWSYAIKDTAGLQQYYDEHKANYMWKERADATIFSFTNDGAVKKAQKMAKKGASVEEILNEVNAGSALILTTDSDKWEKGSNDILNLVKWEEGVSKDVEYKGKTIFVNIYKFIPPTQKELSECRGLVISDYQKQLEEEWVKELREKYPVKVNERILNSVE
jgi:peptidyl-prolyl cis-trans isomerase SurA